MFDLTPRPENAKSQMNDYAGVRDLERLERIHALRTLHFSCRTNPQNHRLEVLSHNLANINTAGFKPHLAMLQGRQSQAITTGESMAGSGTVDDLSAGIGIQPTRTHYIQGTLKPTGNQTDFAINDEKSFFSVRSGEDEFLTRAGNFMFDATGRLVTTNGDEVLGEGGSGIRIDPTRSFSVTDDGAIEQDGTRQLLHIVQPGELGDLSRVGENLFSSLTEVEEVNQRQRKVSSGFLEMSGVEPTRGHDATHRSFTTLRSQRSHDSNSR